MRVFLFALFGSIFGLLLSEVALRYLVGFPQACVIPHPLYNHIWRPNFSCNNFGLPATGARTYTARYNAQGWRQKEDVALNKPSNTFRMFFVGDSFTAGTCALESTMPSVVSRKLTPDFARSNTKLEVINTGTPSYSPRIYYLQIKNEILRYAPDLVLINVDMTDVFDDFLYEAIAEYERGGEPRAYPAQSPFSLGYVRGMNGLRSRILLESLLQAGGKYSLLAFLLHDRLQSYLNAATPHDPNLPGVFDWMYEPWSVATKRRVEQSMFELGRVLELLNKHNIRAVVSAIPHREQLQGAGAAGKNSLLPFSEVARVAARRNIPYFDSYQAMLKASEDVGVDALFLPGEWHYNEVGYARWGEAYADFLLKASPPLLPEPVVSTE